MALPHLFLCSIVWDAKVGNKDHQIVHSNSGVVLLECDWRTLIEVNLINRPWRTCFCQISHHLKHTIRIRTSSTLLKYKPISSFNPSTQMAIRVNDGSLILDICHPTVSHTNDNSKKSPTFHRLQQQIPFSFGRVNELEDARSPFVRTFLSAACLRSASDMFLPPKTSLGRPSVRLWD
jgi:hypothetical protein